MAIGSIDYTSTAPWNDPNNPWPLYSQFVLQVSDINAGNPIRYTLSQFDPATPNVFYVGNVEGNYVSFDGSRWVVIAYEELEWYELNTVTRALPVGYVQGNTGWNNVDGSDYESLSIVADTTCLNPWEFRRRRMLELC